MLCYEVKPGLACLHDLNNLQALVHVLASSKKTLQHQDLEVVVHVAVIASHNLKGR